MRRAALVAATLVLAAWPAAAEATDVSSAELGALASQAAGDGAALAELRRVTSVDGIPANVGAALEGASGPELEARLSTLARSAAAAAPQGFADAATARERVAEALAADDPQPPPATGGEGGVELPSLSPGLIVVLALVIAVLAAVVARSLGRSSVIERERTAPGQPGEARSRPRDLEREANAAERRGEFAAAVRLRFQAGLNRLDAQGAIELRPSLTAAAAARQSGSQRVAALAGSYERVAFGGRTAGPAEASEQRAGWSAVAKEVGAR